MSPERKFLILTSDSGFGHRASANAIAKALVRAHPREAAPYIINPIFEDSASRWLQKAEENYDSNVKDYPSLYKFAYEASETRSIRTMIESTLTLALNKTLQCLVRDIRPDAIVSTNQMFNAPVSAVLEYLGVRIPVFTVVTDLADVHSLWFTDGPDRFYVASERVRERALENEVPPENIIISGIPVDPDFADIPTDRVTLRQKLGLSPELTTLLFVGSKRVSGILEDLDALNSAEPRFQVTAIAGGDEDLYRALLSRKWRFPIRIENFVSNMPDWMHCADLLVTKAGGLILSEGLAAGLPIILVDVLPGQEESNVDYILQNQAGVLAEYPAQLRRWVNIWLAEENKVLKNIASRARQLGQPNAATTIAGDLWQVCQPLAISG
jgi:1,2-diacylglycerol 3-beta-galactosyltransferase